MHAILFPLVGCCPRLEAIGSNRVHVFPFFSCLDLLETSLVLFWRHLDYYLSQYPGMLDNATAGTQPGMGSSRFGHSGHLSLNGFGGASQALGGFGNSTGLGQSQSHSQQSQLSKNFKPTLAEAQGLKKDASHVIKPVLDGIMGLELVS